MQTQHLTIMFTDIKGFTHRTSHSSRKQLEMLLDLHEQLVLPIFKEFNGDVIKTIGDAFLVTFHSPTEAVLCGMRIQKELTKYNEKKLQDERIDIRIAVNSGEVTVKNNDVFGEPVNIAARLEGAAEAGDIYFTEAVYLAMNKSEIPTAEVGYRHFKGIPEEIKVYKVINENDAKKGGLFSKKYKPVKRGKRKFYEGDKIRNIFMWVGVVVVAIILLNLFGGLAILALIAYLIYRLIKSQAFKDKTWKKILKWIAIIFLILFILGVITG